MFFDADLQAVVEALTTRESQPWRLNDIGWNQHQQHECRREQHANVRFYARSELVVLRRRWNNDKVHSHGAAFGFKLRL